MLPLLTLHSYSYCRNTGLLPSHTSQTPIVFLLIIIIHYTSLGQPLFVCPQTGTAQMPDVIRDERN